MLLKVAYLTPHATFYFIVFSTTCDDPLHRILHHMLRTTISYLVPSAQKLRYGNIIILGLLGLTFLETDTWINYH